MSTRKQVRNHTVIGYWNGYYRLFVSTYVITKQEADYWTHYPSAKQGDARIIPIDTLEQGHNLAQVLA